MVLMTQTSPYRDDPQAAQQSHVLGSPSQLACQVCGHHALNQTTPTERQADEPDRLFCLLCGAHRALL